MSAGTVSARVASVRRERSALDFAHLTIAALAALLLIVWFLVPRAPFAGVGSYLPFHIAAETFSVIVSMMIFGVMWNAYSSERSGGMLVLACAMLAAGLLDFGHMLSVSGMPSFISAASPDKGIAFWLPARAIVAVGLVIAALRPESALGMAQSRAQLLSVALGITAFVYWLVLFHLDVLPRFFVEGTGLTTFKTSTEYLITAVLAVPVIVFYGRARRSGSDLHVGLFAAASISMLSELYFAMYSARHDLFQVLGHIYKVVAYLFIYRAVFLQAVRQPFENLHREIAERKHAEEEVRRINQQLEQRVADRTAELEAFVYSVSHELRTPLSPMLAAVQLVQRHLNPTEEMRAPLETIRNNVQVQVRLIDDLLEFSRLSQRPLKKERVDQQALVRSVVQALQAEQQGRHIELDIGELPEAEGDSRFIKQVWMNLIGNALKYTRNRETAVIRVGSETRNGVPVYYVQDNGVGFDMRYAPKLFQVFQRLHRAEDYEGTGIGLAIVHRITRCHGGRVWAQAEKNVGASFYFTLQEQAQHAE